MKRISESLSLVLAGLMAVGPVTVQAARPLQENPKLRIVILEGEGAINRVEQRTAREMIVQVEDENRRPVAGAILVFQLPGTGAGGTFPDGGTILTITTNEKGQATALVQPNSLSGKYEIRVTASYEDQSASAVIHQENAAPPPPVAPSKAPVGAAAKKSGSGKIIAILAAAGGAVAVVALAGGGKPPPPPPPPPPNPSIRIGSATIGAP